MVAGVNPVPLIWIVAVPPLPTVPGELAEQLQARRRRRQGEAGRRGRAGLAVDVDEVGPRLRRRNDQLLVRDVKLVAVRVPA